MLAGVLGLGNQPGASRLTSAEALSMRVSKLNFESPGEVLFQRGKSFESGSGSTKSTSTRLFFTVDDVGVEVGLM